MFEGQKRLTKDEIEKRLRNLLSELDPNCRWYMPDLKTTRDKTKDQNALLWKCCQILADALHSTKEEIYCEAVRKKGIFDFVLVTDDAADSFVDTWNQRGLGWYAEKTDASKIEGATKVICYYGTSVYNKDDERRLLDYIIAELKEQEIDTDGYLRDN